MKKIVVLLFLTLSLNSSWALPELYQKKDNIKTEAVTVGDSTFFTFGFNDRKGAYKEWKWSDNSEKLYESSLTFGLYGKDPENFTYYQEELDQALYKKHFTMGVLPDYSALVAYYQPSVKGLYQNWKNLVNQKQLTMRESLEVLLYFFQDFPYGVPPLTYKNRMISGLFVPPLVFSNGWGDCDSKSLLMATVLSLDDYFRDRLAMILVPGHALLGINILPQVYDETYSYRNIKYVVAEPTGLGRTPLGRKNSPYSKVLAIEPIEVRASAVQGSETAQPVAQENGSSIIGSGSLRVLQDSDCKDGAILIDYQSPSLQVRVQMCQKKVDGQFLKHGPEVIFNSSGAPAEINHYNLDSKI